MAATNNYLTSIGWTVTVNNVQIKGVTDIPDIGGEPEKVDSTVLTDTARTYKTGVQDQDSFAFTYLYSNKAADDDYRVLQALDDNNTKNVPVVVTSPDGTTWTNSGEVSNHINGFGVNEMVKATATITLDGAWTVANPTA